MCVCVCAWTVSFSFPLKSSPGTCNMIITVSQRVCRPPDLLPHPACTVFRSTWKPFFETLSQQFQLFLIRFVEHSEAFFFVFLYFNSNSQNNFFICQKKYKILKKIMFFKFLNSQSSYIFKISKISRNPENFQNLHNFFFISHSTWKQNFENKERKVCFEHVCFCVASSAVVTLWCVRMCYFRILKMWNSKILK